MLFHFIFFLYAHIYTDVTTIEEEIAGDILEQDRWTWTSHLKDIATGKTQP